MDYLFRSIIIYVDPKDNLIIIPTGYSEKTYTIGIDLVSQLDAPYNDEEIEHAIKTAYDQCFTKKPDENIKETPIERFLKVKGYKKAVKDKKVINFFWNVDEGYTITPTKMIPKQGYAHMIDRAFRLGHNPQKGEIAKAIREAMKISII